MMEEIKKYLMDNYDCDDVSVGDTRLIAQSENIAFLIIKHAINKWILRIAPRASFDIWSNSAVMTVLLMRCFMMSSMVAETTKK